MLNPDKDLVKFIQQEIAKNKEKFGYNFCPLVPSDLYSKENYKDYICPCKDYQNNIEPGEQCRCGLYIKE